MREKVYIKYGFHCNTLDFKDNIINYLLFINAKNLNTSKITASCKINIAGHRRDISNGACKVSINSLLGGKG